MTEENQHRPAEGNPWYVLMTAAGEQSAQFDADLHERNRRLWHGWIGSSLRDEEKVKLVESDRYRTFRAEDFSALDASEMAEVERAIAERSDGGIPVPSATIDFTWSVFTKDIHLSKYAFPNPVRFSNTAFERLHVRQCVFLKLATFYNCQFSVGDFAGIDFHVTANFSKSVFSESINVSEIRFFGAADFRNVVADRSMGLDQSHFFEDAHFRGLSVLETTDLSGATFQKEVDLSDAKLTGKALFVDTVFKSSPPRLFNATLNEDTKWFGASWPGPPSNPWTADDHLRAYERLKLLMDDLKKLHDEQFFHRKELECREVIDGFPANLPSRAYGFLSGYGWSIEKPARGLAATVVGGWLLLAAALCSPHEVSKPSCMGETLLLSLSNTFSILGLWRQVPEHVAQRVSENGFALIVTVLQMISGPVLLFLLLLAFRNRYRLR